VPRSVDGPRMPRCGCGCWWSRWRCDGVGLIVTPSSPTPVVLGSTTAGDVEGSATPLPTATAAPTLTATPTPTPTPTPEPTRAPSTITLLPEEVGRGETLLITVQAAGASGGSALVGGEVFPLVVDGDTLFAVVGVALNAALGPAEVNATTVDASGEELDALAAAYEVVTVERPVDYLTLTEEEASVLTPEAAAEERRLRAEQFAEFDRERRWAGLFRLPVEGIFTTQFGSGRSTNGGPVGNFHSGTDIAAGLGTAITAPAAGRVAWVGAMPIRGNTVILDHGAGVLTGYHHLDETRVAVGQLVEAGVVIGLMGSTGLSTGPHLHWEMTIYGVNVDPMTWTRVDFTPAAALEGVEDPVEEPTPPSG
jgi:murein DD-endopeptidase MepM/ murein hydrolase activator NlpD